MPDDWRTFNTRSLLGGSLLGQKKYAEAEPLLLSGYQGMKQREEKIPAVSMGRLREAGQRLVELYEVTGRPEQASEWKERLTIDQANVQAATRAAIVITRGELRAGHGRWEEAVADLANALEMNPKDHGVWFSLAPLLVQSGDLAGYRKHCRAMLARFRETKDPWIADRTCKACLLVPLAGEDIATAAYLADVAVTLGKDFQDITWFQFSKSLAEYRQGHFASAAEWANKVLTKSQAVEMCRVVAYMVLAMSQWCLNRVDEALAALAKGDEIAETKLPKLESGGAYFFREWVIAHILLREAKALTGGSSKNRP